MKHPFINIKLIVSKKGEKLSVRMKGFNFDEVKGAEDLPESQRLLWETALIMLGSITNENSST